MSVVVFREINTLRELAEGLLPLLKIGEEKIRIENMVSSINETVEIILDITEKESISAFSQKFSSHLAWLNKRTNEGRSQEAESDIVDFLERDIDDLKEGIIKYYQYEKRNELVGVRKVGGGAFGNVYKGYDLTLNNEVACKELHSRTVIQTLYGTEGESFLQRFKREVRLMREFDHPNILPVLEVQLEKSPYWYKMPLASCSLSDWIKEHPVRNQNTLMEIFMQVLKGVKYLHDQKKFHRDLAPPNILLIEKKGEIPQVYIADFGLAKDMQSDSFKTAHSAKGYGRQEYTAPEQEKQLSAANHLSDIYSLGAIFYFLFSGGLSPNERFRKNILYQRIVDKSMRDKPTERYQSIDELIGEINNMKEKQGRGPKWFKGVEELEYKGDLQNQVMQLIDYFPLAKVEKEIKVYDHFISPFLSIDDLVLSECCKSYPDILSPFVLILRANLSTLVKADGYDYDVWREIDDKLENMNNSFTSEKLKQEIIEQLLVNAIKYNRFKAQAIVGKIFSKLSNESNITSNIANFIEDSFTERQKGKLVSVLGGKMYPTSIRFALNDF
ncbi:hypothetical protein CIB87_12345 [Priestia megaterium]|uniref:non-specific serine/threonine protein kinase n=1 Tax=Priestia megaterium TaxID=1404 RepID=A0AA86I0T4_PRIMG|nr:serine/threonine-protein kinase [Priestia megaterium]AXI29762.1 hypothetical protein CIB87_12345 [Priestia megaterium]